MTSSAILRVEGLSKEYPMGAGLLRKPRKTLKALWETSFNVHKGETLGIVGESGCGKTTLGRTLVRLYEPTSGKVFFENHELTALPPKELKVARRNVQMIFQDPFSSLNPRMTVQSILEEPFRLHNLGTAQERKSRIHELLEHVGLSAQVVHRFPHEFSGGQRQRIAIARALALRPKLIIADEPVSALDVSIQSQILNLLVELKQKFDLTMIFISHDLHVVRYISDQILVMYLGRVVEQGQNEQIFSSPKHPYTQALLSSVPIPDPSQRSELKPLEGEIPSPANPPKGCVFNTRCPHVQARCLQEIPTLQGNEDHAVACHLVA